MAELALDHDQRHPFARHLDRVREPELVWRKAPADAPRDGCPTQVRSRGCVGPVAATCRAVDDAEQRSHGKLDSHLEPRLDLLRTHVSMPTSRRRPPLPRRTSSAPRR
jgi:hypothetical protein